MHNYTAKIRHHEKRWVQMQNTGDELEMKRTTTENNLIYIQTHIKTSEKLQKSTMDTQRKINSNTTLKIVIKPEEERTTEEGKKKEQQKQIQSN